jgi:hypothetical protein
MQKINNEKYGLTEEEVGRIKLPSATYLVEIYDIGKIINPKSKLSTMQKINHLIKLEEALLNKLQLVRDKKITPGMVNQSKMFGMGNTVNAEGRRARATGDEDNSDVEEDVCMDKTKETPPASFSAQKSTENASVQSIELANSKFATSLPDEDDVP